MKVVYSQNYWAKRKRLQRLPKVLGDAMYSVTKHHALTQIANFHDGIKGMSLGLEELSDKTIARKRRQSFQIPEAPLYGKGDEAQDRSYCNMLRLIKIDGFGKKGWVVTQSRAKHWKANLKLKDLFKIHEKGALFIRKKADGSTYLIRIPPRPAFALAWEKTKQELENKYSTAGEIKKASADFVNKGTDINKRLEKMYKRTIKYLEKFEKKGE